MLFQNPQVETLHKESKGVFVCNLGGTKTEICVPTNRHKLHLVKNVGASCISAWKSSRTTL
jgi:hypothetical protein